MLPCEEDLDPHARAQAHRHQLDWSAYGLCQNEHGCQHVRHGVEVYHQQGRHGEMDGIQSSGGKVSLLLAALDMLV
jgi:hypothetical protein